MYLSLAYFASAIADVSGCLLTRWFRRNHTLGEALCGWECLAAPAGQRAALPCRCQSSPCCETWGWWWLGTALRPETIWDGGVAAAPRGLPLRFCLPVRVSSGHRDAQPEPALWIFAERRGRIRGRVLG